MISLIRSTTRAHIALASTLLLLGCSDSSDNPPTGYNAEIVWTEYGIPHVTADD